MSEPEFDRHARAYHDQHRSNIALTGEEPRYFADYKMRDLQRLVCGMGLSETGHYLDFGSGIGSSVQPFRASMPSAHLVCADVSLASLAISRESHGQDAQHAQIVDGQLPFADHHFDGSFACCVFHHIPHGEHVDALREIRRVTKPGGLLMVYEHNPLNPLTVRAVRTCPFDENAVLVGPSRLMQDGRRAGWRVAGREYRVFFPAPLAAWRPLEDKLRWLPLGAQYFVAFRA
jgi:SAM-dependent methyltransferase